MPNPVTELILRLMAFSPGRFSPSLSAWKQWCACSRCGGCRASGVVTAVWVLEEDACREIACAPATTPAAGRGFVA